MANKKIGKCSFSVFLILDNVRSSNKHLGLLSCLCKKNGRKYQFETLA